MQLKILSWNIWMYGYFDQVAEFLRASNADIIGLQEVKDDDPERNVIGYLETLGYQHVFASIKRSRNGKTRIYGPAIFSKRSILGARTYVLSEKYPCVAVRADVGIGDTTFHVFSTHLIHTHQKPSEEQEEQADYLLRVLPARNTIVMGDFNATPESTIIKKLKDVLADADPASTPTWSVYPEGCRMCNPRAIDTRPDYIFTSKDIRTHSFEVGSSKGSDHLPISVVVEI